MKKTLFAVLISTLFVLAAGAPLAQSTKPYQPPRVSAFPGVPGSSSRTASVVIDNPNSYEIKMTVHCEGSAYPSGKFYSGTGTYYVVPGYATYPVPINVFFFFRRLSCW